MENFQPKNHSPASETPDTVSNPLGGFADLKELRTGRETRRKEDSENSFTASSSSSQFPKTQLLIYLIPVIGFFPSLWTLYRRQGSREQLSTSRLSITLAFTWFLGYLLLATGAETSDFFALRLLILNSFLTSGYFLVSIWLIYRLIQGKSKRLPGFSRFAERVLGKYLS